MTRSGKVFISKILLITLQFALFTAVSNSHAFNCAQYPTANADTSKTLPADSAVKTIKIAKNSLKSKVDYVARDSIRFDIEQQRLYLYGDANVKYEKIELKAGYVELDFNKNSVFASGILDSSGKLVEKPVFTESGKAMNSDTMYYNFKTKKGKIKVIKTEEGEGHILAQIAKKDSNDVTYIKNGRYTTCPLDHPHFYIASNKMKVIPKDKIVTGPAVLVMGDLPTPLVVPFGFFPNKIGRSNGIIIPTYGEHMVYGFYLQDAGYYFGLGDNFDMALKGDIYSQGSWSAKTTSNYLKRYRYAGSINLRYGVFKNGEKIYDNYSESSDFTVSWLHMQDLKANPTSRFNANVDFSGNGTYNKNLPVNANTYVRNNTSSGVNWQKTWEYFNLSTGLRLNQNSLSRVMDINFPNATLSMNRIFPASFFRKEGTVKTRWYDKIGITYSGELQNSVSMLDKNIVKPSVLDSMKAGIRHAIPLSTSFNLNPFVISPSVNFSSLWYFDYTKQQYGTVSPRKIFNGTDTIMGSKDTLFTQKIKDFRTVNSYTASISATTILYGFYQFKNSKVKVIRHKMTPSIGFSYRPDYSLPRYNYYESIIQPGYSKPMQYSYFQNNVFSTAPAGKSAAVSFGLGNNLEMKVRASKKDTSDADQKVTLIENFVISSSYNYATGELSNIGMSLATMLFKVINITMNGTLDPHKLTETGFAYRRLIWNEGKIGTLRNANLSLSTNLNSSKKDKKKSGDKKEPEIPKNIDQSAAQLAYVQSHPGYYVDFDVPWNLNIGYTIAYTKIFHSTYNETVDQELLRKRSKSITSNTIDLRGDFSLTQKWKIGLSTGYDIINKAVTVTQLSVSRDLHCWEMHLSWMVSPRYQSYNLTINVKASVLKDLKLPPLKRDWNDYQ